MGFQGCVVAHVLVFYEDHGHLLGLEHLLEAVQVLESVLGLEPVDFKNFSVDLAVFHFVAYVFQLEVEAIDNDKARLIGVVRVLLKHLVDGCAVQRVTNTLLGLLFRLNFH